MMRESRLRKKRRHLVERTSKGGGDAGACSQVGFRLDWYLEIGHMNEEREVWTTGTVQEKSDSLRRGLLAMKARFYRPLFPKVDSDRDALIEKSANLVDDRDWRRMAGLESRVDHAAEMTASFLKESGYSALPLTDRAMDAIKEIVRKGGRPVTMWTGKLMVKEGVAEEPPAFIRPGQLKVGDQVIPLQFVPMGVMGAKFDLPYVSQQARRVKKIHTVPVMVTRKSFPVGIVPEDMSKLELVEENRVTALEFEPEALDKNEEGMKPLPMPTRESTAIFRLSPMAEPTGETTEMRTETLHY